MHTSNAYRFFLFALAFVILIAAPACGSTTPTPAAAAPTTAFTATMAAAAPTMAAPTMAAPAATATLPPTTTATTAPSPTATRTPIPPTATPQPSATLGIAQDGLTAWCMPENSGYQDKTLTAIQAPSSARVGEIKDNALEIKNLPASACAFLYTFNQAAPAGLKLELSELKQAKPWLVKDLLPVEGSPNTVAVILYHSYIIAPPLWNVSFNFTVKDANGNALRQDRVNLHRWTPKLCWNGQYPNVLTMRCPLPQDLHPWDPSYLTPIPTFNPGDEPEQGW